MSTDGPETIAPAIVLTLVLPAGVPPPAPDSFPSGLRAALEQELQNRSPSSVHDQSIWRPHHHAQSIQPPQPPAPLEPLPMPAAAPAPVASPAADTPAARQLRRQFDTLCTALRTGGAPTQVVNLAHGWRVALTEVNESVAVTLCPAPEVADQLRAQWSCGLRIDGFTILTDTPLLVTDTHNLAQMQTVRALQEWLHAHLSGSGFNPLPAPYRFAPDLALADKVNAFDAVG
jgi:hypothetical protein